MKTYKQLTESTIDETDILWDPDYTKKGVADFKKAGFTVKKVNYDTVSGGNDEIVIVTKNDAEKQKLVDYLVKIDYDDKEGAEFLVFGK